MAYHSGFQSRVWKTSGVLQGLDGVLTYKEQNIKNMHLYTVSMHMQSVFAG